MSIAEAAEDYSIENFILIDEIQKRPILYDKSQKSYNNMHYRKKVWDEVCAKVFSDRWVLWSSAQKERGVLEAHKRWNNLRSSFLREIRSQKKAAGRPNAWKRKKYVYYDYLTFLLDVLEHRDSQSNASDGQDQEDDSMNAEDSNQEDDETNEEGDEANQKDDKTNREDDRYQVDFEEPTTSYIKKKPIKRERFSSEEIILQDPLQSTKRMKGEEENKVIDQDVNFVLSLVPMFKALPLNAKLKMQIDILKLFDKVTKGP